MPSGRSSVGAIVPAPGTLFIRRGSGPNVASYRQAMPGQPPLPLDNMRTLKRVSFSGDNMDPGPARLPGNAPPRAEMYLARGGPSPQQRSGAGSGGGYGGAMFGHVAGPPRRPPLPGSFGGSSHSQGFPPGPSRALVPAQLPPEQPTSPRPGSIAYRLQQQAEREPDEEVNVLRIWASCLALACQEGIDTTWLVDPEEPITMVDATRIWLDKQAEEDPRLHKILPEVMKYARAYVKRWNVAFLDRVHELRNRENAANRLGLNTQSALEASGTIIKSLMNDHSTFSVFLSDCNDGLSRYQRWLVLLTLVRAPGPGSPHLGEHLTQPG